MKTFWKYFLIVILLLIGLCAVGVLYLFFVPGSNLFGITYISYHDYFNSESYDATNINKIEVNSRSYAVSVVPAASENISLRVYANSLGFVLQKNSDVNIDVDIDSGVLIFNVDEPYGATTANKSFIQLRVPTSKAFDIELNNHNAETNINNETIIVNNLIYNTTSGNFQFVDGSVNGFIDANIGRADFIIGENVTTNVNDVSISATSGYFEALNSTLGDVLIESNKNAVILIKECNDFREDIDEAGGRIEIDTVFYVEIKSSDTNVYIKNLTNGGTILLSKSGRVEIENVLATADITTDTGNITIKNSTSPLILTTDDGTITVNSTYSRVTANSNYGDINITFNNDADSYEDNPNSRMLQATTNNGKITSSGVENIVITINDNGRADINMNNVFGENVVDGKTGSVSLIINTDAKYMLHTKTDSGDVSVNLAQISNYGGYTDKEHTEYVNGSITDYNNATLTVTTTSGSLYIRDTSLV